MQSRAAIRYAKAMYDIANEENFINEVYKDMSLIKDLYGDSLDFKSLLSNSQINYQDKKKAIFGTFLRRYRCVLFSYFFD